MRIRFPPQLIVFALGVMVAMAIAGLPRRDHPPPIAADLSFSRENGAPGWSDRLDSRFPAGSSVETLVWELRRQGFHVEQYEELLSGGRITYAGHMWPLEGECWWSLGVAANSDAGGALRDTHGEVQIVCSDTGMVWGEAFRPMPPPGAPPFEGG